VRASVGQGSFLNSGFLSDLIYNAWNIRGLWVFFRLPTSGRYLPFNDGLSLMHEVRLTVKKRAFPSQGRVRLNIAHLSGLGIREGEYVDLVNEATKKSITAAVIADTMVREGHVRVSEEDLKTVGLLDDEDVLVRKTQVSEGKIKKAAANAATLLAKVVSKPDDAVGKTAGSLKKGTKKAAVSVEKAAAKTPRKIKKAPGSNENR
jgi:hypothetical protein